MSSSNPIQRFVIGICLPAVLGGCGPLPVGPAQASDVAPVRLDGRLEEWADGTVIRGDGQFLHLRLTTHEPFTLQGGRFTTRLFLDLDDDPRSGTDGQLGDAHRPPGCDLEVIFSPERKNSRSGISILAWSGPERARKVGHDKVGLMFAPVHAAAEFEVRLDRRTALPQALADRWRDSRQVSGRYAVFDLEDRVVHRSAPFRTRLPPIDPAGSGSREPLPAVAEDCVRVVSWNIEKAAPREQPDPFGRILRALDPDVVLVQEWWNTSEEELLGWFSTNVPSPTPWRVATFGELGVAILSRGPLSATSTERLLVDRYGDGRRRSPVRYVCAAAETSIGTLLLASIHLKAFGGDGSPEDDLRQRQARAIHADLRGQLDRFPDAGLALAGDLNLVGTRRPLDLLRLDLDRDATELETADAALLGGRSVQTWYSSDGQYSPGRLDYALVSDSVLEVARTFVLETDKLARSSLQESGLLPDDSRCSDHRPLVLDLRRRDTGGP